MLKTFNKHKKKQLIEVLILYLAKKLLPEREFNSKWRFYASQDYQAYCEKTTEKEISKLEASYPKSVTWS